MKAELVAVWNALAIGLNKAQFQFPPLGPTPTFGVLSTG